MTGCLGDTGEVVLHFRYQKIMFGEIHLMNQHHFAEKLPALTPGDALACDVFGQLRGGGGWGHPGGGEARVGFYAFRDSQVLHVWHIYLHLA